MPIIGMMLVPALYIVSQLGCSSESEFALDGDEIQTDVTGRINVNASGDEGYLNIDFDVDYSGPFFARYDNEAQESFDGLGVLPELEIPVTLSENDSEYESFLGEGEATMFLFPSGEQGTSVVFEQDSCGYVHVTADPLDAIIETELCDISLFGLLFSTSNDPGTVAIEGSAGNTLSLDEGAFTWKEGFSLDSENSDLCWLLGRELNKTNATAWLSMSLMLESSELAAYLDQIVDIPFNESLECPTEISVGGG